MRALFLFLGIVSLTAAHAQYDIFTTPKDWLGKWTVFYSSEKDWTNGSKMKPNYTIRDTVGIENGWDWVLEIEYEDKDGNKIKKEIPQTYQIGDDAITTKLGKFSEQKWKIYEYNKEQGWVLLLKPPKAFQKVQLEVLFNTSAPDEEHILCVYKRVHAMQFDLQRIHGVFITTDRQRQKPPPYDKLQLTEY